MDTQFPRYEVFLQEKPGDQHRDVGSVHAPDAEMALQNARDVFVRRPECQSLWVVPARAIYSKTQHEIAGISWQSEGKDGEEYQLFSVFNKLTQTGAPTFVSEIRAPGASAALKQALSQYSRDNVALVWWVIPTEQITKSSADSSDSWFSPARDKKFRMSTEYRVLTQIRKLRDKA